MGSWWSATRGELHSTRMDVEEVAVAGMTTGALSGAAKALKNLSLVSGHNLSTYVHNNIIIYNIIIYTTNAVCILQYGGRPL